MKQPTIKQLFTESVFGKYSGELVAATFTSGQTAEYPITTFPLFVDDPSVKEVVSLETGEIYLDRENNYLTVPDYFKK